MKTLNNNRSTSSNGNGNIFHSSRNGSNASASSNSGGHRYKKHLITRPYSPAALVTTHEGYNSAESRNMCSTSAPTKPSQLHANNEVPTTWLNNQRDKSKIPQSYNNTNGDVTKFICSDTAADSNNKSPFAHYNSNTNMVFQEKNKASLASEICDQSPKSIAYNNRYNAKNNIYNIDLTQDRLQPAHCKGYSIERKKGEIIQEINSIPILTKVGSSYPTLTSDNSIPETQDQLLYFDENSRPSRVNAVRLGNDRSQRPRDLDVLSNEKRKTHGYIFHTFGYKSDSTH